MKRRTLLSILGLAPVVASVPAKSVPLEDPTVPTRVDIDTAVTSRWKKPGVTTEEINAAPFRVVYSDEYPLGSCLQHCDPVTDEAIYKLWWNR